MTETLEAVKVYNSGLLTEVDETNKIILLSTKTCMEHLAVSKSLFVDGTFKSCPEHLTIMLGVLALYKILLSVEKICKNNICDENCLKNCVHIFKKPKYSC